MRISMNFQIKRWLNKLKDLSTFHGNGASYVTSRNGDNTEETLHNTSSLLIMIMHAHTAYIVQPGTASIPGCPGGTVHRSASACAMHSAKSDRLHWLWRVV
jgi:hypothetical protein